MSVRLRLPGITERTLPTTQTIVCPYAQCAATLTPTLHGKIDAIWQGHGAPDIRRPA